MTPPPMFSGSHRQTPARTRPPRLGRAPAVRGPGSTGGGRRPAVAARSAASGGAGPAGILSRAVPVTDATPAAANALASVGVYRREVQRIRRPHLGERARLGAPALAACGELQPHRVRARGRFRLARARRPRARQLEHGDPARARARASGAALRGAHARGAGQRHRDLDAPRAGLRPSARRSRSSSCCRAFPRRGAKRSGAPTSGSTRCCGIRISR